jgi:hypothetical protein
MFALYQSGFSVFGTGATEDDAQLDALKWLEVGDRGDAMCAKLLRGPGSEEIQGEMYVRQCTQRLVDKVAMIGGDLRYVVNDEGLLDLDV